MEILESVASRSNSVRADRHQAKQAIRVPFYGIYEVSKASIEVYHLLDGRYSLLSANERGHYPISPMGVELGIWQGQYKNVELPWLRWWDSQGNLLLTGEERAERERQRAEEIERENIRLREQLKALGVEPDILERHVQLNYPRPENVGEKVKGERRTYIAVATVVRTPVIVGSGRTPRRRQTQGNADRREAGGEDDR